ncbi:MAG: HD domain-containing protein [Peptostreptococcaceae bacterium]|jgi:HD superfamily phosphohydrolase|nr:HD domain-containing protein [Peptostreptococcaceae bacterium]
MKKIKDKLYGEFEIEDILYEIIQSKTIQRLKNIHQGGASFLINKNWNVTRYEHSIGVMLLLRILNTSIEQQILGLIHDISHTAFSHVSDLVFEHKNEDYHEKIFDFVFDNSDVKTILKKHNINIKSLLKLESKTLEYDLPALCADRVDYTLRDMYACNNIDSKFIKEFIDSLVLKENIICINSIQKSKEFLNLYCKEVIDYFMNEKNIYASFKLTNILKKAIKLNLITKEDFNKDDYFVLEKIKSNKELNDELNTINNDVQLEQNNINYDIHMKLKPRMIDPHTVVNNKVYKLSELDSNSKSIIERNLDIIKKGIYLKIN